MFIRIIVSFFLLLKATSLIADMNISDLSTANHIEKTTYVNHKSAFRRIENKEKISYIPQNSSYEIQVKPKVLHNTYGTIYLYDLTQKGKFLNAYVFDQLDIDANLSGVTIGLADGLHAEKEYHLKLKNKLHIDLKELHRKIDLSHLKYFIVIVKNNRKFHLNSLVFSIQKKNQKISKSMSSWLWNANNLDMKKVEIHDIHRLYVQVNQTNFPKMLKKLTEKNISIYGLNGAPSDINDYTHLLKDIDMLVQLKKKYAFIEGYQIDVEPYLLPKFNQNKDLFFKKYMKMVKELKEYAHERGLKFSVVIPFWFDTIFIDKKNLGFYVCDVADEIVLMSYRSDLDKVIAISRLLLSYAGYVKKDIRIGIELMKIEDEQHEVFEVTDTNMTCLTPEGFFSECATLKKLNEYTLKGSSISFYQQIHKLKALYEGDIPYTSFKGYVLHYLDILPEVPFIQRKD